MVFRMNLIVSTTTVLLLLSCMDDYLDTSREYYPTGELRLEVIDHKFTKRKCGTYYRRDGTREKHFCYQDDKIDGEYIEYNSEGSIKRRTPFSMGLIEGFVREFYPGGQLKESLQYQSGKKQGLAFLYFEDGGVNAINYFHNDAICYKKILSDGDSVMYESVFPVVKLSRDSLRMGDTLEVTFTLPSFEGSTNILAPLEKSIVRFDFGRVLKDPNHLYTFPRNHVLLSEGVTSQSFLMEDTGRHLLYGHLEVWLKDTIVYDEFNSIHFYLEDSE